MYWVVIVFAADGRRAEFKAFHATESGACEQACRAASEQLGGVWYASAALEA